MTPAACMLTCALAVASAGVARADAPPAADLAQGPYAVMHMRLQKTFLKVNVADVDVRVDRPTQARFAQVAAGQAYSPALESQLAAAAIGAARAVVQMQFLRDVSLNRWMAGVRDNLEAAREAGLISRDVDRWVSDALPVWFASLKDRGYLKGDRVTYAVTADALRTTVTSAGGQVLLDASERGNEARRVVLATYFAPKSDTREALLRSLLNSR